MADAMVVGAGPAGLMAAEQLGRRGLSVTVADAMPSVGRKFLMAGKSGLNLTKVEPAEQFAAAYEPRPPALDRAVAAFGPEQVMAWATGLGQPLFTGSTGRVFPTFMKASPLLRAWLARLDQLGVQIKTRWRWQGWDGNDLLFDTPTGRIAYRTDVTILALGGASWARLGADGHWARHLTGATNPFKPANMGFDIGWSSHMRPWFGTPVKATALMAGGQISRGEWVISQQGIEGGGIYALSATVRDGAELSVDLKPDWPLNRVQRALARPRDKTSLTTHLRKTVGLSPVQIALLNEFGRPFPADLASSIKRLPMPHAGPRPMDQAISTAGGVRFDALSDSLMLNSRPGTFCAGEMLDWEAPTGGYLITGCLATGVLAAQGGAKYIGQRVP